MAAMKYFTVTVTFTRPGELNESEEFEVSAYNFTGATIHVLHEYFDHPTNDREVVAFTVKES
jgi:glycyl-tRNA synthetase alpha subunit